jgi:hypothetical protein
MSVRQNKKSKFLVSEKTEVKVDKCDRRGNIKKNKERETMRRREVMNIPVMSVRQNKKSEGKEKSPASQGRVF